MKRPTELTNRRFNRLVAVSLLPREEWGGSKAKWNCQCDCGTTVVVFAQSLTRDGSQSCGCLRREMLSVSKSGNQNSLKHGHTTWHSQSPEYRAWAKMKDRCKNPTNPEWKNYGGRGITVCERWRESFENFLADMGLRPSSELSLDRIDNDGNYEAGNCRWATKSEQTYNRRRRATG